MECLIQYILCVYFIRRNKLVQSSTLEGRLQVRLQTRFIFMVFRISSDIRKINSLAVYAKRTGMIILGGGLVKHHIANANLMVTMAIGAGCRGSLPVLGLLRFSLSFRLWQFTARISWVQRPSWGLSG